MGNDLTWDSGDIPRSQCFDDIYYDADGAEESRFNFLSGCGLPDAWAKSPLFVIGETGFGTGLNFLVTLEAWRTTRRPGQRLHFVSVEAHPMATADLARAHQRFEALGACSRSLLERYPESMCPGFQRIHFDDDGVILDLLVGDAAEMLGELEAIVDAWFLDGFAPSRNPEMWRHEVLREIARLSRLDTRLATFTAAGEVRRGLERVGYAVHRTSGFGTKRERIVARFDGPPAASALPAWAQLECRLGLPVIQGDGIGGRAISRSLDRRGVGHQRIGGTHAQASHVPLAMVMPRLTTDDSIPGRFFHQAFRYARRTYRELDAWHECGAVQIAADEANEARYRLIGDRWAEASYVDATEASEQAGLPVTRPALFIERAGFVRPEQLLERMTPTGPAPEAAEGPRIWATGGGIATSPVARLLPISGFHGQVTLIRSRGILRKQRGAVFVSHYLAPPIDGQHMIGSTYDPVDPAHGDPVVEPEAHDRNVSRIAAALDLDEGILEVTGGWAGIRAALPDRLPAAGPAPDPSLFEAHFSGLRHGPRIEPMYDTLCDHMALAGLGARGFTAAPLCAELITSQLLGEPWPVPRSIALALAPVRFLVRGLKRRQL